jgi:acetyl-CoA acetyltransferase family protein
MRVLLGEAEICLVGGTESMSQAAHIVRGARWGLPLGQSEMEDQLWASLTDSYCGKAMAITAEDRGKQLGVTREEADLLALQSQERAGDAAPRLAEEIVPVEVGRGRRARTVDADEHPRPETTAEALASLRPYFAADGSVTAGNASGIVDGAAALVVASRERADALGLRPLGRLVSWGTAGVDPKIMGIGPVPSSRQALERAGLSLDDMDLVEINEAFAPQAVACEKELGVDRERLNVNGGAVALGHPLGATGSRLALTALMELRRRGGGKALVTMCIGGGQGIAGVLESI